MRSPFRHTVRRTTSALTLLFLLPLAPGPAALASDKDDKITTSLVRELGPKGTVNPALFGHAVGVSGKTAVVGAVRDNSAFVFERDQGGANRWGQTRRLIASDRSTENRFGGAVAVSGDIIAVGDTDGGDSGSGAVYLFQRNRGGAGKWGQLRKVVPSDPNFLDRFGGAVALQGKTLAVGASLEDAVYIFLRDKAGANRWGEVKKLVGPRDSSFGTSVAAWGDLVLVGADSEAYLFGKDQGGTNKWGLIRTLTAGEDADDFGDAVALSGLYALVGAPAFDVSHDEGAAYLFQKDLGGPNAWGRLARLREPNPSRGRRFGFSVAIAGNTALVGSRPLFQEGTASFFSKDKGGPNRWGAVASWRNQDGTFGGSVALTQSNALVGQDEQIDAGTHNGPGRAFVFAIAP